MGIRYSLAVEDWSGCVSFDIVIDSCSDFVQMFKMKSWQPNMQRNMKVEAILISEFLNAEIRITSTFMFFAKLSACHNFISKNSKVILEVFLNTFAKGLAQFCQ